MPDLTLWNGDCLEIMKQIPDKSIDLIICDLPYGCLSSKDVVKAENHTLVALGISK
jgi:DNA modification methylase